jgi:hypothetical protein
MFLIFTFIHFTDLIHRFNHIPSQKPVFNQDACERAQVTLIAKSELPFQILSHPELLHFVTLANLSPRPLSLLSPKTALRRLQAIV